RRGRAATVDGCPRRPAAPSAFTNTGGATPPPSGRGKPASPKNPPAAIEVRDAVKRVNLASHVGQRVSVTGTLVDRQMRVGSLQPISMSCSTYNSKVKI